MLRPHSETSTGFRTGSRACPHLTAARRAASALASAGRRGLARADPRRRAPAATAPVVLGSRDLVPIVFHFARLDPEDRQRRFNGRIGFAAIFARIASVDWQQTWMLGCVDGGRIVGLAELYEIDGGTECSVSVLRSWQGRGVATALLGAAIDRVCRDQRRDLVLLAQSDNLRLTRLALHLGATATRDGRDVTLVFRPSEAPGGR